MRILGMLVMVALTSGCVIAIKDDGGPATYTTGWQARQELNRSVIPQLPLGTPIETVTARLGEPEFSEAFMDGGAEFRVLFYRTHHVRSDGRTTRDETTPVVFMDGKLHGIGDDFYRRLMGM